MKFNEKLGTNIREIRKLRGLSLQELSLKIEKLFDIEVSANLISMWERGERRVSAEHLYMLCKCLECTPNLIIPGFEAKPEERFVQEYSALSENEKAILDFAATKWDGNTHALIQFSALYMSLPRRIREGIAFFGISAYEKGQRENSVDLNAPPVDLDYLEKQWKYLLRK